MICPTCGYTCTESEIQRLNECLACEYESHMPEHSRTVTMATEEMAELDQLESYREAQQSYEENYE